MNKLDLNKNKTNLEKKMYRWEKNGEALFKEFLADMKSYLIYEFGKKQGTQDFENIQTYAADINEDGIINIQDIITIINIILQD